VRFVKPPTRVVVKAFKLTVLLLVLLEDGVPEVVVPTFGVEPLGGDGLYPVPDGVEEPTSVVGERAVAGDVPPRLLSSIL
jgi:hypothetical protein